MEIKRCYDTIVGASVVENQLASISGLSAQTSNGVTFTPNANGSYTITGTATGRVQTTNNAFARFTITNNRKYAVVISKALGSLMVRFSSGLSTNHIRQSIIVNCTEDTNAYVSFDSGVSINDTFNISNLYVSFIDLTALLGSSIADYVYTIETATAGSGIAWLRSYGFLGGYVPYNAGSIESVEVTGKVVRGFNQWDEEWEVGRINGSTGALVGGNGIRSKDFIPILPNASYYVKCPNNLIVCQYDENKSYISTIIWGDQNKSVPTSADAKYLKVGTFNTYGNVYKNDICINLSSDRNGEYEPYTSQTYALGSDTLRGIFKLDANNQLYADGDRKEADGTITRRYGVVDLGTLTWEKYDVAQGTLFRAEVNPIKRVTSTSTAPSLVCSNYVTVAQQNRAEKTVSMTNNSYSVDVIDSAYTDAATFKTAMSGVMLVYELATPTTEQGDPFPSPQVCYPDGTEEFVTENGVPVGHETKYQL